jgi:hypothetical protein
LDVSIFELDPDVFERDFDKFTDVLELELGTSVEPVFVVVLVIVAVLAGNLGVLEVDVVVEEIVVESVDFSADRARRFTLESAEETRAGVPVTVFLPAVSRETLGPDLGADDVGPPSRN